MRILLNTIPRAASKWLHSNLLNYLSNDNELIAPDLSIKEITNWFEINESNQNAFQGNIIQRSDKFYFVENKNIDINIEMAVRLDLLLNYKRNIVAKIHPVGIYAFRAIEKIKQKYDLYYTLNRRNKIEQVLSMLTAQELGIYSSGSPLDEKIIEVTDQPVFIDYKKVKDLYNWVYSREIYMLNQNATKHLYFEELIEIKDPCDFCDYLMLPRKDFIMCHKYGIEYGINKPKLFQNYAGIQKYLEILTQNI